MIKGNIFHELADLIQVNRKKITDLWQQQLILAAGTVIKAIGEEKIQKLSGELLDALIKAMPSGIDISNKAYEPIVEILRSLSLDFTRKNCTPSETATYIFSMKDALLNTIQSTYPDKAKLNEVVTLINKLIDTLSIVTFEAYVQAKEMLILKQQRSLVETAVPVVKVWDRILMVPLIGILDSERTQLVMDRMLSAIEATQAKVVLIDITGIPTVDTLVARNLTSTAAAIRLMGAECIISGISALVAQTVVQMGVELKDINTKGVMADGLREAFALLGLKVTTR